MVRVTITRTFWMDDEVYDRYVRECNWSSHPYPDPDAILREAVDNDQAHYTQSSTAIRTPEPYVHPEEEE